MRGNFFAVGKKQWAQVCQLGMNPAVAFLVLARGTGADNRTTRWSGNAVEKYAGISWRRADSAIAEVERVKLLENLSPTGKRPTRKFAMPDDMTDVIWLPNTLIDGVADTQSPIARLRRTQKIEYLQAFVELYAVQDLAGDGGIPRSLIYHAYRNESVCESGPFVIYGFNAEPTRYCYTTGPLSYFRDKVEPSGGSMSWTFLSALAKMGLLEEVEYLAESGSPDAELIHALSGDEHAEAVRGAARAATESLPEWVVSKLDRESYEFVLPVLRDIPAPAVVGIYRLTYRPHTGLTAAWWAKHLRACQRFTTIYEAIGQGDYVSAISA